MPHDIGRLTNWQNFALRLCGVACGWMLVGWPGTFFDTAIAQELTSELRVDEITQAVRAKLDRAAAATREELWEDALDLYTELQSTAGEQLLREGPSRWITLRHYCQRQLAALPPAGLIAYRERVDPQARQWYQAAAANRDRAGLARLTRNYLASSWGGPAFWLLGELHLEKGSPQRAREAWGQLLAPEKSPEEFNEYLKSLFPATEVPLQPTAADISARLILCTLAQGDFPLARQELDNFAKAYPAAPGKLGGKSAPWSELLGGELARRQEAVAAEWEQTPNNLAGQARPPWSVQTFAGNPARNFIGPQTPWLRSMAFPSPISLGEPRRAAPDWIRLLHWPNHPPTEDYQGLLATVPVLAEPYLVWCDEYRVFAWDLRTGKPAWPSPRRQPGEIFVSPLLEQHELMADRLGNLALAARGISTWGIPRFTVTVRGNLVLARLGWPVTNSSIEVDQIAASQIVCLDLDRQGYELWSISPPGERWSFAGTPVCDRDTAYVALRYRDARPQWHVAAYDLATGRPRWRRFVCAGERLVPGNLDEVLLPLLTLGDGRVFLATQLGAVAALSTETGELDWISQYDRLATLRNSPTLFRDLAPPVSEPGRVYVAPLDSAAVCAFEAATGKLLWNNPQLRDVVYLLGTSPQQLIGTGRKVWWIDKLTGRIMAEFPDTTPADTAAGKSVGRGFLAGGSIYWPRRDGLYILNATADITAGALEGNTAAQSDSAAITTPHSSSLIARPPHPWSAIHGELHGGHLVYGTRHTLVADATRIWCLGEPLAPGEKPLPPPQPRQSQ